MISKVRELNYAQVQSYIDELCVANMFFKENTVPLMKKIVPEYISNNSELCKLDEDKSVKIVHKRQNDEILHS